MRTMVGLRFYNMDMVQYTKKAITILDQIQNLEDKGLKFFDVELAKDYMLSVGYFRLDSYFHTFMDSGTEQFIPNTTFETIIYHYRFDCELRSLIFAAIQDIEIAIRTRVVYFFSLANGPFWYAERKNFKDRIINILNFKEKSRKEKNMYRAVFALIMISLLLISGKFIPGQTNKVPSNNNIKPLTSYPKDYSVEEALADNMVVSIHGDLQGDSKATLKIFLLQVNKKQESLINIYTVTIEGDPILTRILFKDKKFLIEYDNSRDYYRDPNSSEMVVATRNFIRLIDDGTTSYLVGINDDNISDQEILKSLEKENNIIWLLSYFK